MGQSLASTSSVICGIVISFFLILWRFKLPLSLAQIGFQTTLMWGIIYNAYFSGGVSSPVMIWMGIVPILPLFTVSRRWSYAWLFISFSLVIFIYWGQTRGLLAINNIENQAQLALRATMIGMLCITQMILVMTYDSANSQVIRHIKKRNKTLLKLSNDLQILSGHKDKFLATVSHEMRTPLNAIMGYLGLLANTHNLDAIESNYVQGAQNASAHLVSVINDLLDFSQIQQGKFIYLPQTINLPQTFIKIHESLAPIAADKLIDFSINFSTDLPSWVLADSHRLSQIYLNLLRNALRFTSKGGVYSHISFLPNIEAEEMGTLLLDVRDTGIGIDAKHHKEIFEPFIQLPNSSEMTQDNSLRGNGLGLSITRSLIQKMGGSIEVLSTLGSGSTFKINIPITISSEPLSIDSTKVASSESAEIHLLIVDDHATNRLVVAATIKKFIPDARIDQAKNGSEAIQKMIATSYDLVLMDLIMPDLSGIEVVRQIRTQASYPRSQVKVIALTANIGEDVQRECHAVGILDLLPKPFVREVLIQTILKHSK